MGTAHSTIQCKNQRPKTQTKPPTPAANFLARFFTCLAAKKMQQIKDPAIKLFGKEIPLQAEIENTTVSGDDLAAPEKEEEEEDEEETEPQKGVGEETAIETLQQDDEASPDPKTPSINEESETAKSKESETGKEDSESPPDNLESADKTALKKPDKILPCPRCNSMDTKFCYYNNYNVNQPRHFCKACQRYWTAGGTMRNVPVGAGRRKNKNSSSSASHYCHITISEALQAARIDATTPLNSGTARVLSFNLDPPISDSNMSSASALNLGEKKVLNGTRISGIHRIDHEQSGVVAIPGKGGENNCDDYSSASSDTREGGGGGGGRKCLPEPLVHNNINGFLPHQIPCLPGVPWPYPWNHAVPPPAFCPSGLPMPFYPAAPYWNCTGVPGTLSLQPWLSPQKAPNSPTLGKHSRDEGDMIKMENLGQDEPSKHNKTHQNGCVLVPKTLRIDDPSEAAKSSIWATLGIKNESISGGGMFEGAFQSKGDENKKKSNHLAETSPALLANPAALSRSLNFHESS